MINPIKFITLNIKGLNSPIKRKRVYTYLKKLDADIVYFQETHLSDEEHRKLKRDWVGQVFSSSFNAKSRGTTILINKNIPFTVSNKTVDPSSRFILVQGHMYLESLLLLNIYADQSGFIINRLSSNNIRHLLNIIHFAQKKNTPSIALSLDAEKAFDRLEWPYLFKVLEKFGFLLKFGSIC